ncbi:hypothetical protein SAMN04489725_1463 [Alicyclobacillus hesperidum]|uniref:Uncharacterized protein n=1 Tax=Alicyclobacillus hesperidum TaxID=89784 RepID=A0A1H2YNI8_9BACL|nr:hypothetical protein [Alicyclobacillus hesperidum]SDX06204.1 hypothetical protein SAMN04489725_1463 [Alicyclobacillus hesperidum]
MTRRKWWYVLPVVILILVALIGLGIQIYHNLYVPVPKQDTILVGTHQDPDTFNITDSGTNFKVSDHLIVDIEYKPQSSRSLPSSSLSKCIVVDKTTGKTVQTTEWVDTSIMTGKYFDLNNQGWKPGLYEIKLYRFGKLDTSLTITLH